MKIPKTASPSGLSAAFSGVPYWKDEEGFKYLCKGEMLSKPWCCSEQCAARHRTASRSQCARFHGRRTSPNGRASATPARWHQSDAEEFFFLVAKIFCGICRGQFRNRFAILGLLLLVVSLLNGLIWQVLPWTGQEWLLQWDYCPQPEAWRAMMRPCWSRTTQNPDQSANDGSISTLKHFWMEDWWTEDTFALSCLYSHLHIWRQ